MIKDCAIYVVYKLIPEVHNQQEHDLFIGEVLGILEQFGKVVLHWLIGDIYGGFHLGIVQIHTAPFLKIKGGKMVLLKRKRTRLFYSVISRFGVLQAKKGFWLGLYIA